MSSGDVLELTAGKLSLRLSPAIGGSIHGFAWVDGEGQRPILRQCPDPLAQVLDAASFPLVPYVNRIRNGSFEFRGRRVTIKPNMAGDPSPLHGQGWLAGWTVEESTDRRAVMRFTHEAGEWPWRYEAWQMFELNENGLSATLGCRNLADSSMPCGLGFHPYFPCTVETRLKTSVEVAWTVDDKVLPVAEVPAEGRYDLKDRAACGQGLDNGFGGWSGDARMTDPSWPFEIRLSSADARFFQLYSPADGGIFVAEPVTHANAALNESEAKWPELGLRILEIGEEMSLSMRIDIIPR